MQITDPRAIRAMAHPLRLELLELLAVLGSATAATCAARLGTGQASCSFHLRQLERYGFVERIPGGKDRRERPWRLTDLRQEWAASDVGAAAGQLDRVLVGREADRLLGWIAKAPAAPPEWRGSAFLGGATVPLTSDELREVRGRLLAVLDPYLARLGQPSTWPDGARPVRVLLAGTPDGAPAARRSPGASA